MALYRIDYWPGSGNSPDPLTAEQIERRYPKKSYFFSADSDYDASGWCGVPGAWGNSDGVLLLRIDSDTCVTPCYQNPFNSRKPDTPRVMIDGDL